MMTNGHDTEQNGNRISLKRESTLSIAIKNFSPQWFTISMDTGILSILLNLHPWRFPGIGILSTIMFTLNLIIFVLFTLISLVRVAHHSSHIRHQTLTSLEEHSYLGAPLTAYLTLVAQIALTCSTAWGYRWTLTAYALWWIGVILCIGTCSSHFVILIKGTMTTDAQMTPAIFLPLISVMTLGTTGGLVCNYSADMTPSLAIPVIVVGYMALGYALFLSLMYYAFLAHKLLAVGLPEPRKIPALVITVGPTGQFATAIQVLSSAADARGLFGGYEKGTWLKAGPASSVGAAAVLIALLALGFAVLWVGVAWYFVIGHLVRRNLPFSLAWWSLIFPMGVFTTALLNLSKALDSSVLRGFVAALLIFLFILYSVNWAGTLYKLYTGEAMGVPQQRDEEDEQAREKKGTLDRYFVRKEGRKKGRSVV